MAYNRIIIVGRLTADPELRQTQKDRAVANATVAVDRPWTKGKDEVTDFFRVTAWGKSAEFLNNYFHKGDEILVEGAMQSRKYTGDDGITRTVWEVQADNIRFVGYKKTDSTESTEPEQATADVFEAVDDDEDLPF